MTELNDDNPSIRKAQGEKIVQYKSFKCSSGWIQNFMRRNCFHSVKGGGEEGFVDKKNLFREHLKLKKELCKLDISCISNTDEVAVLY